MILYSQVPQILINLTPVQPRAKVSEGFDVELIGTCDEVTDELRRQLGWGQCGDDGDDGDGGDGGSGGGEGGGGDEEESKEGKHGTQNDEMGRIATGVSEEGSSSSSSSSSGGGGGGGDSSGGCGGRGGGKSSSIDMAPSTAASVPELLFQNPNRTMFPSAAAAMATIDLGAPAPAAAAAVAEEMAVTYNCDECGGQINVEDGPTGGRGNGGGFTCTTCFGYDLCGECHRVEVKTKAHGHVFSLLQ